MSASLVWITPNAGKLIGKIARVSSPQNEDNPNVSGLLKYLIRNKHWSPFEMASMCVEIKTTRAIAAQIIRHRSFSFQEFSQRYAEVAELPVIPELRRQDLKNRQNSIDDLPEETKMQFNEKVEKLYSDTLSLYNEMLSSGVAKECARGILPMNSPTRIYMSGTIRSWIHYIQLQGIEKNGAQKEHILIAKEIAEILNNEIPEIMDAVNSSLLSDQK